MSKTCIKITFRTKKEALAIINNNPRRKTRLEAFKCDECGFWHVGHPNKKQMRLIRYGEGQVNGECFERKNCQFKVKKVRKVKPIGKLAECVEA